MDNTKARSRGGRKSQADESFAVLRAQEDLVLNVQTGITKLLRERGLKQTDLARLLDVSPPRVSQMLGDDATNLTLRSVAKIYHVLDAKCRMVEIATDGRAAAHLVRDVSDAIAPDVPRHRFRKPPQASSVNRSRTFELHRAKPAEQRAYA